MFSNALRQKLKNVHAYAVTPFVGDDLLSVDRDGFAKNLEFLLEHGVQVINVGGGTGEIDALTPEELAGLARDAVEVVGERALVTPSLPGNLAEACRLAPLYQEMGVQAALAMAPFTRNLVPEDLEGVYRYYRRLGQASDLALLPYNTQGWPAEFFARLAEIDAVIGVKDPCHQPHNLFRAIKLVGDRLVWIGNKRHDPGVLHFRYQAGIEGFTAGFINFAPHLELELHRAAGRQDWPAMVELQGQLAPLERLRNRYSEGLLKAGLDLVGLVGGAPRPPRVEIDSEGRQALRAELERLGLAVVD